MEQYKYPVRETINGITLIFNGPEMDPVADPSDPKSAKDKDGAIEEYFLWRHGDPEATHSVWNIPNEPSGHRILVQTRRSDSDKWEYEIWAKTQEFRRKRPSDSWGSSWESVSLLRIKLGTEAESPVMDQIKTSGNSIRIEHKGSTCSVNWNPATRRYTRKC